MLEQTTGFVVEQLRQVRSDIIEMEEVILLLHDAGENTSEQRRQLVEAKQHLSKWENALRKRGIEVDGDNA